MTFAPAILGTGYLGWVALKRTQSQQTEVMVNTTAYKRDAAHLRENIGAIRTAEALVGDRRMLNVALTAYGLEGDLDAKAFVQKVLQDGTLETSDLANKLSDKAYVAFSKAFGFGDYSTPRTVLSDFPDEILSLYQARSFELAVGEQNNDYRLALNAERELADLASSTSSSDDTLWYKILGSTPLRTVMQTALGLPSSIASQDIDQQLRVFKERSEQVFGDASITQFTDNAKVEKLVKTFLLRSELAAYDAQSARSSAVLMLLGQSVTLARNPII